MVGVYPPRRGRRVGKRARVKYVEPEERARRQKEKEKRIKREFAKWGVVWPYRATIDGKEVPT